MCCVACFDRRFGLFQPLERRALLRGQTLFLRHRLRRLLGGERSAHRSAWRARVPSPRPDGAWRPRVPTDRRRAQNRPSGLLPDFRLGCPLDRTPIGHGSGRRIRRVIPGGARSAIGGRPRDRHPAPPRVRTVGSSGRRGAYRRGSEASPWPVRRRRALRQSGPFPEPGQVWAVSSRKASRLLGRARRIGAQDRVTGHLARDRNAHQVEQGRRDIGQVPSWIAARPGRRVRITTTGTGLVVCAVCGPPVSGSFINSQLPWSAVTSSAPPWRLQRLDDAAEAGVHRLHRLDRGRQDRRCGRPCRDWRNSARSCRICRCRSPRPPCRSVRAPTFPAADRRWRPSARATMMRSSPVNGVSWPPFRK